MTRQLCGASRTHGTEVGREDGRTRRRAAPPAKLAARRIIPHVESVGTCCAAGVGVATVKHSVSKLVCVVGLKRLLAPEF
jgi:hypothetical protein